MDKSAGKAEDELDKFMSDPEKVVDGGIRNGLPASESRGQ